MLLRIAKWPYVVLAVIDALLRRGRPYVITRKIAARTSVRGAVIPHLSVAGLVGIAWATGAARGVIHDPALHLAAGAALLVSAGIAASAAWSFPDPYSPELAGTWLQQASEGSHDRGVLAAFFARRPVPPGGGSPGAV